MLEKSPKDELSTIRAALRKLRLREAEILDVLLHHRPDPPESALLPRPGWPIRRLSENRPN